ncbi:Cell wall integrity protein scw1 [Sphaceloma murrayae]|uniref:Cell wall integrity protein scw1 n=1 Tax=Sphaceloma murrayae TaxID=2082308 RepID=A0A2K1QPH2_9PEZI|nr:Cell wall integrity protein scw1 [Sphaceloma murrayae]
MPPDLNSLPPSRSPSTPGSPLLTNVRRTSSNNMAENPPSPRSPPQNTLHATAAINAGLQRNPSNSRTSMSQERRRSSLITSLNLNNADQAGSVSPQLSGQPRSPLMNTADPHHQRTPSLGQIHQQLENEQEAQVNRLLQMIRTQQEQLTALQGDAQGSGASVDAGSAIDTQVAQAATAEPAAVRSTTDSRSPSMPRSPLQRPTSLSRQSSRGTQAAPSHLSNASSPSLRPLSATRSHDEWSTGGIRDESAFYQAETQMLHRENQMLKIRIRELERQINDMNKPGSEPTD